MGVANLRFWAVPWSRDDRVQGAFVQWIKGPGSSSGFGKFFR